MRRVARGDKLDCSMIDTSAKTRRLKKTESSLLREQSITFPA
jgi:hypothetical protein